MEEARPQSLGRQQTTFTVYDYYDDTVLLGKLGTDLAQDVGSQNLVESYRKKDYCSLSNADSSCLAAEENVRRFVPSLVQFQPLKTLDFLEDARCNYRKV